MEERKSFIDLLFSKLSQTIRTGEETNLNSASAQREVKRQIQQAAKGDPITGSGVTKFEEKE